MPRLVIVVVVANEPMPSVSKKLSIVSPSPPETFR
jgi:hypothetical protein